MSRKPVMPNLENCSLAELETAANATADKKSFVRILTIKTLCMGFNHQQAADLALVTVTTVRNWIKDFNKSGVDGLITKARSGRPRKITSAQSKKYRKLIRHPEKAEQTHWTAKKFHGYVKEQFQHEVSYRTVVRWLHEQDFRLKVPQSWPDRQDESSRQAFLDQLKLYLQDPDVDIWYQDESGIEGDPRPRRRWAQKGEKIKVPYQGSHLRLSVSGMVCPRTGEFFALEFPYSNTGVFQVFLDEANKNLDFSRKRNILILDNASWHHAKSLNWGGFEPFYLPPYSPDLNPIERLWLLMKAEWFSDFIAKDDSSLEARADAALNWLIDRTHDNQKTCAVKTKL